MAHDSRTLVIVGAGVVGCAIAAAAAERFAEVYLLEMLPKAGMLTSSRNSGVLHSGLYYAAGSRKGFHCLRGNRLLREFCQRHDVPWRPCGKLVVASAPDQVPGLEELARRGAANGVEGLELLDGAQARRHEPHLRVAAGLWVPSAGVLSAETLVRTLLRLATERGADFAPGTRLLGLEAGIGAQQGRLRLRTSGGEFTSDLLINAAGLYADEVARMAGEERYTIYPVRGEYCHIHRRRREWVHGLIYPLPTPLSLGIHVTRSVEDGLLLGPTARYVTCKDDYESDLLPREFFLEQGRHILPELELDDLTLAYSGLRPKLIPEHGSHDHSAAPRPSGDFVAERDARHGNIVHLLGIESPGLTACLSLAQEAVELVAA